MNNPLDRVQVRDLPSVGLQGATIRPRGPMMPRLPDMPDTADRSGDQLMKALSGFSNVIASIQLPKPDEAAAMEKFIATTPRDKIFEMRKNGTLPVMRDPSINDRLLTHLGTLDANVVLNDFQGKISRNEVRLVDDNGEPVDFDAAISKEMATRGQSHKDKAAYWHAARTTIESGIAGFRTQQREQIGAANQARLKDVAAAETHGMAQAIVANPDLSDEDVAVRVNSAFRHLRRTYVDGREANNLIMGRIEDLSSKGPAEARAALRILNAARVDDNGGARPTLSEDPAFTVRADVVRRNADNVFKQELDNKVKTTRTTMALNALTKGDGSFNTIVDEAYENKFDPANPQRISSASEVKAQALTIFETNLVKQATDARREPAKAMADIQETLIRTYVQSNVPNKKWAAQMNDVGKALADPQSLMDPENMARAEGAYKLYQDLRNRAPSYLENTLGLSPDAKKLFEKAEIYERLDAPSAGAAIQRAAAVIQKPPPELTPEEGRMLRSEAATASDVWFGSMRGLSVNNKLEVREEVERLAKVIARDRGITPDKAVGVARGIVADRSVNLNGRVFISDPHIRKENVELWQKRLSEVWEENKAVFDKVEYAQRGWFSPRGIVGSGEGANLSVQPIPGRTGAYTVMWWNQTSESYEPLFMPTTDADGNVQARSMIVHLKDIERMKQERLEAIGQKSQARGVQQQKNLRYSPTIQAP
jgi:hypothetical protein